MPAAFVLLSPDEYAGLQARVALSETRISQLEQHMATEVQAVANLSTQVAELTAAVGVTTQLIADLRVQVGALEAAVANNTDVTEAVTAIAGLVDDAEKALLAAVTPPAPPPVEPPVPAT